MGVVHVALDPRLQREVALKVLRADVVGDERAQERFLREALALSRVVHRHVVRLLDAGRAGGHLYLATELIAGEDLARVVAREGPLEPRRATRIAVEVAGGLAALHAEGIVHRDVKPQNVLLGADGAARLVDLGVARVEQDRRLTVTGEMVGTPAYMPPEQAAGERGRQGPAADVYGLGATLYHLLTGRPPFVGGALTVVKAVLVDPPPPPRSLRPELDPRLEQVVLTCLAKDPAERYPTPAALAAALEALQAAPPPPPRRRAPIAALAAAVGVAIAGAAALMPRPAAPEPSPLAPAPAPAGERAPEPLRLAPDALVDPGAWPGLEVEWPLGLAAREGALTLAASGRTRPEVRLPLRRVAGPLRVRAALRVDVLERSTALSLVLEQRAPGGAAFALSLARVGELWGDPGAAWCGFVARGELPGEAPRAGTSMVALLLPGDAVVLELSAGADPEPRVELRAAAGPGPSRLVASWPLARPLPPGDWWLRVGANLAPGAHGGEAPGDPTCALRARLEGVDLEGLEPDDRLRDDDAGRLARASRALVAGDEAARDEARAAAPRRPSEPALEVAARYVRLLLTDDDGQRRELVEALWDDAEFQRRWRLDLFALPDPLRRTLAAVFHARALAGRDEVWVRRFAAHRVWGDKGNVRAPEGLVDADGQPERRGGETLLFEGDPVAAHDRLTEATLGYLLAGQGTWAGAEGLAAAFTGELERGRDLLRREARHGNKDAFMHFHWGLAALRLGDLDEALEAWQGMNEHARGPAFVSGTRWGRHYRQLAPLLEALRAERAARAAPPG
ncbi:MAG: serine/threonine protein kinase [Planctomycetes bacterium]|nr:serine/threonine protein kinase [Planctomycetota bacterium]